MRQATVSEHEGAEQKGNGKDREVSSGAEKKRKKFAVVKAKPERERNEERIRKQGTLT
jgi:hypothetical protein